MLVIKIKQQKLKEKLVYFYGLKIIKKNIVHKS